MFKSLLRKRQPGLFVGDPHCESLFERFPPFPKANRFRNLICAATGALSQRPTPNLVLSRPTHSDCIASNSVHETPPLYCSAPFYPCLVRDDCGLVRHSFFFWCANNPATINLQPFRSVLWHGTPRANPVSAHHFDEQWPDQRYGLGDESSSRS